MLEIDWFRVAVGMFGVLLIINAVITISSKRYFLFFKKSFFIEPISREGRDKFENYLKDEESSQRYILSAVAVLMGIIAIAWMFGVNLTYF